MHTVHHAAFGAKQNRVGEVCCLNQLYVVAYRPAGCGLLGGVKPIAFIQLPDVAEGDVSHEQGFSAVQQFAHIPNVDTPADLSKVVLRA